MPASALTVQAAALAGLNPSYAAANADGNYFPNSGREVLHVKNGHSGSQTVTVDSPAACNQGSTHDVAVAMGKSLPVNPTGARADLGCKGVIGETRREARAR